MENKRKMARWPSVFGLCHCPLLCPTGVHFLFVSSSSLSVQGISELHPIEDIRPHLLSYINAFSEYFFQLLHNVNEFPLGLSISDRCNLPK